MVPVGASTVACAFRYRLLAELQRAIPAVVRRAEV